MELNRRLFSTPARLCLSLAFAGMLSFVLPPKVFAGQYSDTVSASAVNPQTSGWLQKGNQWQYRLPGGSLIRGGWIKAGDGWYYFNSEGIMVSDTTLDIEGHTYRFESTGAWIEDSPEGTLFVQIPSGRFENSAYEHPWARIRVPLPKYTVIQTAEELHLLSAHDYIPSYYDFLAITPDQSLFGVMIQYNSDPIEKILSDDFDVFSSFWGQYDLSPTVLKAEVIAGQTYRKMVCQLPEDYEMNVYLRSQDHKVVYLFTVGANGKAETADRLIASIVPSE